ncbi:MAG: FAD-dependent oxidoreductase [Pseudomonadales bacterium]|nr:FAD-dependent oxidoreductase [Pseudomonadales bacterium]MDP6828226.1 FAD-dependent oxidoreductase [Pseudomonadales bacterium]
MKCLESIEVGHLTLKNRFSLAPMDVRLHTHDGYATERSVAHYRRMARGGAALINLELHVVRPDGCGPYYMDPRITDDSYIPGMAKIADAIHEEGAFCQVELGHFGKFSSAEVALAVSADVPPLNNPKKKLREMDEDLIQEVLQDFVTCALRVKRAGFDGVMLHGAHGFLPQQFMSPHSNRRTDRWGQERLLFPTEMVRRVRDACGKKFLIGYRLSGDEYYRKLYEGAGGYTVDDLPEIVPRLVDAGVDSIDISAGALDVPRWYAGPDPNLFPNDGYGGYLPLSEAAKKVSDVPVIVTGQMGDPDLIERAIAEGQCDMAGMAKQFLADPDFPNKVSQGRTDEIRRCINCGFCAVGKGGLTAVDNHSVECAINPELGWALEGYHDIRPTTRPRRVMVVGGGVGGMEAARVLKLKGHDVTLYEKTDSLGGQLPSASVAPGKSDINLINDYLAAELERLEVDVCMNTKVDLQEIEKESPYALILATGAEQFVPPIPGIDGPNVVIGIDALMGRAEMGRRVVLIGGEEVACEVADHISRETTKEVTVTSLLPGFATKGHMAGIRALMNLRAKDIRFVPGVREYQGIDAEGVRIIDADGNEQLLPADTVVISAGSRPANQLAGQLADSGLVQHAVYTIGDAVTPRSIYEAIHEGATVAQHI